MRSGFICSSPCDGVIDQEVGEPVKMAEPAVAARIVAELSLGETGGHGDDAVDVVRPGHPAARISVTARPNTYSASAYDSGEGVKPGMGRWNSSW